MKLELNHKVHVLSKKEELDTVRVAGKIVVVLDILRSQTRLFERLSTHDLAKTHEITGYNPDRTDRGHA